jgi:hypothetical protein
MVVERRCPRHPQYIVNIATCPECVADAARAPSCDSPHLINGEFQSDKYPTTPRGKVPLSVKDATAQDLLWEYAQRRRAVDAQFAADLETALRNAGFVPSAPCDSALRAKLTAYQETDRGACQVAEAEQRRPLPSR